MKRFLTIAGTAALVFIAASMLQERETFMRSWFTPPQPSRGLDSERREAAHAVQLFRSLYTHFYASGGDIRFTQRMPASQAVLREMTDDVAYVARNARRESPQLVQMDVISSDVTEGTRAVVTTREYWVTGYEWLRGGDAEQARSDVITFRYRLARDGSRWIVTAWDPIEPPAAGEMP